MRIGIQGEAYISYDCAQPREGFARMKRHGYDAMDYGGFIDTTGVLFTCSEAEYEDRLCTLRQIAEETGIEIAQTHGPWRYPPKDLEPEDRAERMEKMQKSLHGVHLLGGKYMVLHPLMPYGDFKNPDPEGFLELNELFYRELLRTAAEEQVTICFENMPMPYLNLARPSEIRDFVRKIDDPWFKVCLDTGHCLDVGQQPAQAVRGFAQDPQMLRVLHVHDNDGFRDLHLLPYQGIADWPDFTKSLQEIGFEGVLSLETQIKAKLPEPLLEYEQIGLARLARKLADG